MLGLSLAAGASAAYWVSTVMLSALLLVSVVRSRRRRRRATATSDGALATKQCFEPAALNNMPWHESTCEGISLLASSYYRAYDLGSQTSGFWRNGLVSDDIYDMIPLYWRRMQKLLEEEATRQQPDNYTGGWSEGTSAALQDS